MNDAGSKKQRHVFGQKLRALREERGLSQAGLATSARISQSYISKLESGSVKPTPEVVAQLARFFEISLEELAQRTGVGDVLRAQGFAEYGYCPNVNCPETLYRWVDEGGYPYADTV